MRMQLILLLLLGAWSTHVHAAVDLSVTAAVEPAGSLSPGSRARLTLVVGNRGPDVAPSVVAVSSGYPIVVGGNFDLLQSGNGGCTINYDHFDSAPGEPHFLIAVISVGTLAPGESRACEVEVRVFQEAFGRFDLEFSVGAAFGNPESNLQDNTVVVPLVFGNAPPRVVDVTGRGAQWLLGGCLAGLGWLALRRR